MSAAAPRQAPRRRRRGATGRRPRRLRFDLRKALFVLPNLFTVSSIFCGFYAMTLCLNTPEPIDLYRASIAIFFGMFFDAADGRVARLTRTQSEFGVQLDSLADLVTFGAAPGILLYRWSLHQFDSAGMFVAFLYTTCGALRLARFNVLAAHETGPSKYFVGLPIPLAAGTVVAIVMASVKLGRPAPGGATGILFVTLVLAVLMVSTIRYRTFKDLRPTKKSITITFLISVVFLTVSEQMKPEVALAFFFLGYICFGLLEEVIFFRKRREERAAARLARAQAHGGPPHTPSHPPPDPGPEAEEGEQRSS
jgi:CDP-diacylglycerol--serine O-phosphatidyltransferase